MSLSPPQLATLREVGRLANELELRHDARRAARATQQDYIASVRRKLDKLPGDRDKLLSHYRAVSDPLQVPRYEAALQRMQAEEKRLQAELTTALAEYEQLLVGMGELSAVSSPLRELIPRILAAGNLDYAEAGVPFGEEVPSRWQLPPETISIGGR